MRKRLYIITVLWTVCAVAQAQELSYPDYMAGVLKGNLEYAAQKLNVPMAEAELKASKVFNDPSLSVEYANNSDWDIQMGRSVTMELTQTISPGKRAARMGLASSTLSAAEAGLDDFLRNLRADATLSYLDALLERELADISRQSYENMASLASGDSLRSAKGELSELDAMQSRLERNLSRQDMSNQIASFRNALISLDENMGDATRGTVSLEGALRLLDRQFVLVDLLDEAVGNRSDVILALRNAQIAESELRVIRRDRNPDIDVTLGTNYNTRVHNEEAPAPTFWGISAGVSIPLQFSNLNKGAVRAGQVRVEQARLETEQLQQSVRSEVMKAYNLYETARQLAVEYDAFLMDNAREILQSKIYAYNRGETPLLEVLNAQRTFNDVAVSYAQCLHGCLSALVELERSAGIWDITL